MGLTGGVSYFGTSMLLDAFPSVRHSLFTPALNFACDMSGDC